MSSESFPTTTKAWSIEGQEGFESLKLNPNAPLPDISDYEVLVRFYAASLNYRDLTIPRGRYPFPQKNGIVPCSDGAGEVLAIGPRVTRFQPGSKVVTLFNQAHLSGSINYKSIATGLGGALDGTLRQHGIFNENGLVDMPPSLTYLEGSTLPCAAVTAWNALYGLKTLIPGDVVLTQGTGGVSMFALQFAKAAGAKVIATTSSEAKVDVLKKLGADHVINYKQFPDWGKIAAGLTTGGEGVNHIVEVGGPATMAQSLKAVKIDGVISMIGFLGGIPNDQPGFFDALRSICIIRGVVVGNRMQFEDMNRAIEANAIKPVVDEKVFEFEEIREAYQYMWDQKHFGKVVIKIN